VCDLKTKALILTLMVTLFLCGTALAQISDPPPQEPLRLTDDQGEYPLGLHLEILEDPSGELTIDSVSSPEFDSQFTPNQVAVPNIGFTESATWVRFDVQNESRTIDQWLLEVAFPNIHFIDLYTPLPGGEGFAVKQTGIARPPKTRDILHPHFAFNLTVPTQNQQSVYLRFKSDSSIILPITLWKPEVFFIESQWSQILYWLYFGALIGLLIYNLFLLFSLRDVNYLYLVTIIASLVIFDAAYAGYLEIYIIPQLYFLRHYYMTLSFALIFVSTVLFADIFLELKAQLPKLHRVNLAILGVWGILTLLIPFIRYYVLANLMVPWGIASLVVVLTAGIVTWRGDFRPARFFMIAWLGFIFTFILVLLVRLGEIPSTIFTENAYRLGWVWMAVCWSLALAERINLLKAETEAANLDLSNSEHRLSQILEGLPLGVVVYGRDQTPKYVNQRTIDILSNPEREIQVDISIGRTLAQALSYFSLKETDSDQEYPLERLPIYRALHGEQASVDDIEADLVDRRVPLELWASPVLDDAGNVESAVVAFQDITHRKKAETELAEYRQHLENLVKERTSALNTVNEQLQLRLEWLSTINLVNQIMARSADFTEIYEKIIEIINNLFDSEDAFIAELDGGGKEVKILAHSCRDDSHPNLEGSVTTLNKPIQSNPNISQGKLALFNRNQLSALSGPIGLHFQGTEIHTIVLVPLNLRGSAIGFLGVELHDKERTITGEETTLLGIISFDIAKLIEDSHQFEQTKALITAEERNRLARDLHDSVTQVLFSANLLAEVLPKIWRRDPEQGLQRLDKLQGLTRGALAEMRTMLLELRPAAVINTPLDELLAQLTEAITSRSGLPFHLFIEKIPSLPENVQTSYYRIAQEALNNVVKHAQANHVSVSLSATPLTPNANGEARHEVNLVIQDDGVGFSSTMDHSDRLGIGIMEERAEAIQASFSLESKLGYGTQVSLTWSNGSGI
jgi:signal transduction histidine kinase